MRFSIVTPSYRQSCWLRLCVASVADQGVPHEHLVQDAGSDDGTLEWLLKDPRVTVHVEKDAGMYDAINRGLKKATGDIAAYLNCDEQYLPGALEKVGDYFAKNPQVEVVFGDVIKLDPTGNYLSFRRMQTPLLHHTWTCHLSTLTCATFFRRSLVERGCLFDTKWKIGGDGEWMVRLLQAGVKMGTLGQFTSAYTETGGNLSSGEAARKEALALRQTAPLWARLTRPALIVHHRFRRLLGGMYSGKPESYSIYTQASPEARKLFKVE